MTTTTIAMSLSHDVIIAAAQRAARAIPPLWPLASSVAVNPFLGQASEPLEVAAARLRRASGIAVTMPRSWYAERLQSGEITEDDLQAAFQTAPAARRPAERVRAQARHRSRTPCAAGDPDGGRIGPRRHGDRLAPHRQRAHRSLGRWLLRSRPGTVAVGQSGGAYSTWRIIATHDLTPEIAGLAGFSQSVSDAPATAEDALVDCVARLGLSPDALDGYFHRLLTTLGGWGQVARYRLWQAELNGGTDACVTDLLAIRMLWEAALLHNGGSALVPGWQSAIAAYAAPVAASSDDVVDSILQEAAERAAQRKLNTVLAAPSSARLSRGRLTLQMAFCIDVRSEVFRRALESLDSGITTLGFAGFFGFGIGHRDLPRTWSKRACRCC